MKCYQCPDYNQGRGSKVCIKCNEYKDIVQRAGPCINYVKIPREMVENIAAESISLDIYRLLSPKDSTIIFQRFRLNLTYKEIASLNSTTKQAIKQRLDRIISSLKALSSFD